MADYNLVEVSDLDALENPSNSDVLPIQDGSGLKKITYQNLKSNVVFDEANARQNADNLKLNKPTGGNGTSGQMLLTNGDGTTQWTSPDSTLATTGKAADAKATGDAIKAVDANLAAPYSTSLTYAVGDYCIKDGQLYRCTTAISTAEAWTSGHWSAVALADDTRDLRSALSDAESIIGYFDSTSLASVSDIEQGGFNTNGLNTDSSDGNYTKRLRTKDYIPVAEGDWVSIAWTSNKDLAISLSYYTANDYKTPRTGYTAWVNDLNFIIPNGVKYIRVLFYQANNAITPSDITNIIITKGNNDLNCEKVATEYKKGTLNADGTAYDGANGAYTPIIPMPSYIKLGADCRAVARLYRNGTYLGKIATYSRINQTAGSWMFYVGIMDVRSFMYQYNANEVQICVLPTDGSTVTDAQAYGESHVEIYVPKVVTWASDTFAKNSSFSSTDHVIGADLIKRFVDVEQLGQLTYVQAFCIYDGSYYSINGTNISVQDSTFTQTDTATLSTGHGNALQLGNSKYAYASGWNDQKIYKVDLENLTIADTITLPTTGYTTGVVDEDTNTAYIFQRDSYPDHEDNYNFIVYDLTNQQVVSTRKILSYGAMQAADFFGGRIIVLNGLGNSTCPNGYRVFDTNGNVLAEYFFNTFASTEPEGVCIDRTTHELYISLVNGKLYKVTGR